MDELNKTQNIEEDEIDLKELFYTLLKYKYKILFLSFVIVCATLVYVLSIPNSYKSQVTLSPQGGSSSNMGGLSSLASLAGVSLGGGNSSKDPSVMMQTTLSDYEFNKNIILKYSLIEKLENPKNLVFAMGLDTFAAKKSEEPDTRTLEDKLFNNIKTIQGIINISSDKKSGLIVLSAELTDRFLAKELVDIYLDELTTKIKQKDMKEIDEQIKYYNKELANTYDVSLKEQLSKSLSALMQKRVFSMANDYYFVSKVINSRVSHIREKTKPKRALILIVSLVTSLILGIFLAFFMEFIRNDKKS